MNAFDKLDNAVLRFYQGIVDSIQVDPRKLMMTALRFYLMMSFVSLLFKYVDHGLTGSLAISVLVYGYLAYSTLTDPESWLGMWFRRIILVVTAIITVFAGLKLQLGFSPEIVTDSIGAWGMVSFTYFGACNPPAPPRTRQQFAG